MRVQFSLLAPQHSRKDVGFQTRLIISVTLGSIPAPATKYEVISVRVARQFVALQDRVRAPDLLPISAIGVMAAPLPSKQIVRVQIPYGGPHADSSTVSSALLLNARWWFKATDRRLDGMIGRDKEPGLGSPVMQ